MRIAVVDDHPIVYEALSTLLRSMPGEHAVSGFTTLQSLEQELACGVQYDLVLLDLGLPGFTGLSALERLRARNDETPVVVLSALDDRRTILDALDLGAMGFIPKNSRREVLMNAIELVASGGIYIPPEAITQCAESAPVGNRTAGPLAGRMRAAGLVPGGRAGGLSGLTGRQREVLALLLKGMPNKAICRQLNLSSNTVKSHVSAIFRTLDVSNRTQAVIAAERLGVRVAYGR